MRKGIFASPWADPAYKYFLRFFQSPYFTQLLGNTLIISLAKLALSMPFAIAMAILLSEARSNKFRRIVQTVTYMPHFLSWVILYGILFAFLSETRGLVNLMLRNMGFPAVNFLSSPRWFRSLVVFSTLWKETGWGAIIYLAAIIGVDPTLYEAARVDGAGRLRSIWHITLPGIRAVTIVMFLLKLGSILDAGFDQIYIMYNIHVYSVGDIIDTWVFRTGLEQWNFSMATAVGLFKSLIGLALIAGMNALARRW
ncbi:MAG TPA: ABC transporter permease subunit, partial [Clostridia bacterium]|nr:ABC transporter permease subunit [Clostridia bacterium]